MENLEAKIPIGLTFNDVLLMPQYSTISSRSQINLTTRFSRNVPLNLPIVSSPMDTVTENEMAIEMARYGGLGIIHRYNTIEDQTHMISKVKRAESFVISKPYTINLNTTVKAAKQISRNFNVKTFLVTDETYKANEFVDSSLKYKLLGILTGRDLKASANEDQKIKEIMTPREKLIVTTEPEISLLEAKQLMITERVEKLPIVSEKNEIVGLITLRDILAREDRPLANLDKFGRLRVGAAIGAKDDYLERAKKLIDVGCDVLVVDIANGHAQICIDAVERLKEQFTIDVVAGSVATRQGAENLIKAGADGIRCGIGSGAICTTRLVAGSGVPQLSAVFDTAPICNEYRIPLISDGGNGNSGNMCKALGAGADCVMVGRLIAGCDEGPGQVLLKDGKRVKIYRGMAGYGANLAKAQKLNASEPHSLQFTPEGVEGYIPYLGPLKDVLNQFGQGIKSGMSYSGASNIEELKKNAKFIRLSQSSIIESGVHDIGKFN